MSLAGVIGIAGIDDACAGQFGGRRQAVSERLVARDLAIFSRSQLGRGDLVMDGERLGRETEVVSPLEGPDVRFRDRRIFAELLLHPVNRRFAVALIKPVDQA